MCALDILAMWVHVLLQNVQLFDEPYLLGDYKPDGDECPAECSVPFRVSKTLRQVSLFANRLGSRKEKQIG